MPRNPKWPCRRKPKHCGPAVPRNKAHRQGLMTDPMTLHLECHSRHLTGRPGHGARYCPIRHDATLVLGMGIGMILDSSMGTDIDLGSGVGKSMLNAWRKCWVHLVCPWHGHGHGHTPGDHLVDLWNGYAHNTECHPVSL